MKLKPKIVVRHNRVDYGDLESTEDGLMSWKDTQGTIIQGVTYSFVEGSDEHLDAIVNNSLESYLEFN